MEILSDEEVYLSTATKLFEYRNYTNIEQVRTDKLNYLKSDQAICRCLPKGQKKEIQQFHKLHDNLNLVIIIVTN
jgi:hypothetical protein